MKNIVIYTENAEETRAAGEKLAAAAGPNMVFLMKVIADGKEKYGLPEVEHQAFTSFPDGK